MDAQRRLQQFNSTLFERTLTEQACSTSKEPLSSSRDFEPTDPAGTAWLATAANDIGPGKLQPLVRVQQASRPTTNGHVDLD